MAIGTPNSDTIDPHHPLDYVADLHLPYHRHIPSAAELQRMASEGGWQVVEFRNGWKDTRVPFVNSAFEFRYFKSSGGFADAAFDPRSSQLNHILVNPSLIFWGLFGSFFSRKNEMVVVAAPPNANFGGSDRGTESGPHRKATPRNRENSSRGSLTRPPLVPT
jgi:hypothetical protein